MARFTHFDEKGASRMVDVSAKKPTLRTAQAQGIVSLGKEAYSMLKDKKIAKGDVLEVSRLAGIMGAKKTSELIPLCHPLKITSVSIDFELFDENCEIKVVSTVKAVDITGVEMEALTAVTVAALTIYDMCKAVDKAIEIKDIYLIEKTGGKSGTFRRKEK
ncbi:MAG: cyclic pyranopterin monophosphate synthase MoaC [Candidatus Schekmanbacteria bacterium]|nr:MAG: cyclic pyranopterin monophosphate synthase MoaC [Candidatus Schekmanbacteria bacterium]